MARPDADPLSLGVATPLGLLSILLTNAKRIVIYMMLFGLGAALFAAIGRTTYTAEAAFIPQTESSRSSLVSLAARMGMQVPTNNPEESPGFYARLIHSRSVLLPIVQGGFLDDNGTRWPTLSDYLNVRGQTTEEREADAVKWLQDHILVAMDPESGVITYSVSSASAAGAFYIAEGVLSGLHAFNETSRQFQASAERRFVEASLREREVELLEAETRIEQFLSENREFRQSPTLMLRYERLQRELLRKNEIVTSLAQSYEQARIEEVRNTPRISVVEPPVYPVATDRKRLVLFFVLGIIFGALLAAINVLWREVVERSRTQAPSEYERFQRLRREVLRLPVIRAGR
jgi:uncharacterized protein involved in exopolysaccharide biosynthesis